MRVLITGGTGYLGDWIARELLQRDHKVTALARDPLRAASLAGLGAEVVPGDLLHIDGWRSRVEQADALIHAAATVRAWGVPDEDFDAVNIQGTETLVRTAVEAGVKIVIVTGSLFALGPSSPEHLRDETALATPPDPVSEANAYARTKALSSRRLYAAQQAGSPVMQVFPTILVGPGVWSAGNSMAGLITRFANGRVPGLVGGGDQVWNFVGVRDAAQGHLLALEHGRPGQNYILAGDNWTQRRFFEFVAMELDRKAPRRALGRTLPLMLARTAEWWARLSRQEPLVTAGEVLLSREAWAFSGDKARRALGFDPAPLDSVLRETIAWLRDEIWPRKERDD